MEPKLTYNENFGTLDISFKDGDIELGGDLEALTAMSLFTDARCSASDFIPDGSNDQRGCWYDTFDPVGFTGSKLWLFSKSRIASDADVLKIRDAARASLQWLIDQGIAKSITVGATRFQGSKVALSVTVTQADKRKTFQFDDLWRTIIR